MNNSTTEAARVNKGFDVGHWSMAADRETIVTTASAMGDIICEAPIGWPLSMAHWEANARLIAAAPELLDFIRECATDDLDRVSGGMKAKAIHLLAKATQP